MAITYERELNPEQLDVVRNGDGPCLVLAGAGSGKTRTIVYRVAYLLEQGVLPQQILLLTFTNKAANEMLGRVEMLLSHIGPTPSRSPSPREGEKKTVSPPPDGRGGEGGWAISRLWGGTFHHVANRILRRYAPVVGYQSNFTILDEEDSEDLLKLSVKDVGVDTTAKRFPAPRVLKSIISVSRNAQRPIADLLEERHPKFASFAPEIEDIAQRYDDRKRAANSMDFDDLLVNLLALLGGTDGHGSVRMATDHTDVGHRLAQQFRYILVDEYQDTNRIQAAIVGRLADVHRNLLVVGDDAQSIYSFRAADVGNILRFPDAFSGARTFRIETNYRSAPSVLQVANAVIANNEEQFKKTLRPMRSGGKRPLLIQANTMEDEARYVAKRILELRDAGMPLREIAVLFRAGHLSEFLEMELVKRDIPYDYRGGIRFFERAHVKDILAFLKVLINPQDEAAWLRVLRMQRGIGDVGAMEIIERITNQESGIMGTNGAPRWLTESFSFAQRLQQGWVDFFSMLNPVIHDSSFMIHAVEPAAMIRAIAKGSYRDYLESEYPNWEERLEDIEQLAVFAAKYEDPAAFLADTSLQELFGAERVGTNASEQERIVLSTIHQAKGLEWKAVFIIGLTAAAIPNRRALLEDGGVEEERRLFYVAITRAKDVLTLSYALSGGVESSYLAAPSPFLSEIPPELLEPIGFSHAPQRAWRDNDGEDVIHVDVHGERIARHKPVVVFSPLQPKHPVPRKGFLRDVNAL